MERIRIKRSQIVEIRNSHVRWDEYLGGDSDWRGGEIFICGKGWVIEITPFVWGEIEEKLREKGVAHPEAGKRILGWCDRFLPTGSDIASPEAMRAGWEVGFEVDKDGIIRPILNPQVRKVIINYLSLPLVYHNL